MQAYDFGLFKTLSTELKKIGITDKISAEPIPAEALNENEPYILINVGNIKQTVGLNAKADIEISFPKADHLQPRTINAIHELSKQMMCLMQSDQEVGTACLRVKSTENQSSKFKVNLQAFIMLKRIYKDG